MKKALFFVFVAFFAVLSSCSEDCNCPDENDDSQILGMWERTATDNDGLSFDVIIVFEENGDYSFLLAEPVEGHTNSYANYLVSGNVLTITNDTDCEGDGVYEYTISDNMLSITATNDECGPRKLMLEGMWTRTFKTFTL